MRETDKEIIVESELPGISEQDIDISLTNDRLTLKREKKQESEEKKGNFHRLERSYGAFHRDILLPCEIDRENVTATYKNGILKVTLPKTPAVQQNIKKIDIKSS